MVHAASVYFEKACQMQYQAFHSLDDIKTWTIIRVYFKNTSEPQEPIDKPTSYPGRQDQKSAGAQRRSATTPGFSPTAFPSQDTNKSLPHLKTGTGTSEIPAHTVPQDHRAGHPHSWKWISPPYLRGFQSTCSITTIWRSLLTTATAQLLKPNFAMR